MTTAEGWAEQGEDAGLFDYERPAAVSLADKFGVPPMSVLDRRAGDWQARKRRWLTMGIESELGRGGDLLFNAGIPVPGQRPGYDPAKASAVGITAPGRDDFLARLLRGEENNYSPLKAAGVSVFDPVLCELAYRWHTLVGDAVLDPFAGGSVRGIVASVLQRNYTGIDLRGEQVAANRTQAHLGTNNHWPVWIEGDSTAMDTLLHPDGRYDMLLTCPPYGDLEVYSDDPRDLSTMDHQQFLAMQQVIIYRAAERLREHRFAVWVTSDIRDKKGAYRGLVADTIGQFESAGMRFWNDAVLLDPVGTAAVRAERPFRASRKLTRVHQHMLVFLKGDAKQATQRLEGDA
jgi:hypothetical protein